MSDELPTAPLPQPNTDNPETRERRLTRTALIALSVLALLLLIGLTIVLTLLLSGRGDTPPVTPSTSPTAEPSATASDEPSEEPSSEPGAEATTEPSDEPTATSTPTPTPTPTPPPPPPSNDPVIKTFKAGSSTVACNTQSPQTFPAYISFSWSTTKADRVYFGVDTNDAQAAPLFDNLPPSGTSQADFPAGYNDFEFGCPNASHKYTLTVVGSNGKKVHKTVTITNIGDTQ